MRIWLAVGEINKGRGEREKEGERRKRRKLLDLEKEEITKKKKRKDLEPTSSQPYEISDKEQALLLMKISCQSTGPCRK